MKTSKLLALAFWLTFLLIQSGCDIEQVSPGLYRGPDPGKHTLEKLKSMGVKTIISVRLTPHAKRAEEAREMGFKWVHIPTGVFLCPRQPEVKEFLQLVKDPKNQPCYLACTLGADRTGYYIAIYRIVMENWEKDKAMVEMKNQFSPWWPAWYVFHDYKKKVLISPYTAKDAEFNELVSGGSPENADGNSSKPSLP